MLRDQLTVDGATSERDRSQYFGVTSPLYIQSSNLVLAAIARHAISEALVDVAAR